MRHPSCVTYAHCTQHAASGQQRSAEPSQAGRQRTAGDDQPAATSRARSHADDFCVAPRARLARAVWRWRHPLTCPSRSSACALIHPIRRAPLNPTRPVGRRARCVALRRGGRVPQAHKRLAQARARDVPLALQEVSARPRPSRGRRQRPARGARARRAGTDSETRRRRPGAHAARLSGRRARSGHDARLPVHSAHVLRGLAGSAERLYGRPCSGRRPSRALRTGHQLRPLFIYVANAKTDSRRPLRQRSANERRRTATGRFFKTRAHR